MSLETWKAEFYPIDANQVPVESALDHSITKWKGLRADNIVRHDLKTFGDLYGGPGAWFYIDSSSCALCKQHIDLVNSCPTCPIVLAHGRTCAREYQHYRNTRDPEPMITLLESSK